MTGDQRRSTWRYRQRGTRRHLMSTTTKTRCGKEGDAAGWLDDPARLEQLPMCVACAPGAARSAGTGRGRAP